MNADGTGRVKLPIRETDVVLDSSRDGTWLATRTAPGQATHRGRLTLVHPDGTGAIPDRGFAKRSQLLFTILQDLPGRPERCLR